jgi:hypothetical protein
MLVLLRDRTPIARPARGWIRITNGSRTDPERAALTVSRVGQYWLPIWPHIVPLYLPRLTARDPDHCWREGLLATTIVPRSCQPATCASRDEIHPK